MQMRIQVSSWNLHDIGMMRIHLQINFPLAGNILRGNILRAYREHIYQTVNNHIFLQTYSVDETCNSRPACHAG